ncbi:MAG: DUF3160 domain-containing protein [Anaerolineae bacterium]|nr:DUF3160 domain-containing protein [Anaerolineae bacterium]
MKTQRLVIVFVCVALCGFVVLPAATQGACPSLPTRLIVGQMGQVAFTDGQPLNVRAVGSRSGAVVGRLSEGATFEVLDGPSCADAIAWWQVKFDGEVGWIAEAVDGVYLVEPQPGTSVVPTAAPVVSTDGLFAAWDWSALAYGGVPDPMTMALPVVYAGNMPSLPVELAPVLFVDDAKLSSGARALLAQNGFVVVPEGAEQFSDAYREFEADWQTVPDSFDWQADPTTQELGHPMFVTTDSMLHALHYIFDNLLSDLEREALVQWLGDMVVGSLQSAVTQYQEAIGTSLETPARNTVLYLLVAARLMASDSPFSGVDDALIREADALAALAFAGEGQETIPFLTDYREDFSQ